MRRGCSDGRTESVLGQLVKCVTSERHCHQPRKPCKIGPDLKREHSSSGQSHLFYLIPQCAAVQELFFTSRKWRQKLPGQSTFSFPAFHHLRIRPQVPGAKTWERTPTYLTVWDTTKKVPTKPSKSTRVPSQSQQPAYQRSWPA